MLRCFLLAIAAASFTLSAATKTADPVFAPLWAYDGKWKVTRANASAGAAPEQLSNECSLVGQFFACQQSVNGKVSSLVIFMQGGSAGHYYTQTVLPEGRATGRDDLEISGNTWIMTSSRYEGAGRKTYYRNTQTFSGKNRIHFEQSESSDGKQWTVKASGDETRVGMARH